MCPLCRLWGMLGPGILAIVAGSIFVTVACRQDGSTAGVLFAVVHGTEL